MAEYTLRMTSQQNHPPVPHLVPGDRAVLDFPMRGVFAGRQGQDLVFSRTDGGKLVLPGVFAAHTLPGTLPAPGELPGEAPGNLMGKASSLLDTADKPGGTLHLIVHGRDMSLEEFLAALGKEDMPESGMAPSARVRFHEYADAELMHGIGGLGGLELSLSRTGYETAPRYDTLPTRQDKENDQLPARGGLPDTPVPPAHHVPTVDSFAYALAEDGVPDTVSGNALAGAHPGDGNNIFAWVTPPSAARYGSISLNPDGTFTYTIDNSLPIVQELGVGDQVVEHFIYTYTDAAGEKATGSLDISIIGTNDVPTVAASTASVSDSGSAGVPSGVSGILPAPHDPDAHDTVSFLPQNGTPGAYGTFTLHTDGTWSYDLDNNLYAVRALAPGDSLTETFTYTVSDNHGGTSSNTLTVTINGTNDAPAIAAAATSVTEDTQLTTSGTLPAPSDPDRGDTIAFVPQNGTLGHYGSLTLGADGSYSYTLNNNLYAVQSLGAGETLTDTFTYTVTDSHGAIGSNTLTVTINGTNDAPTVAAAIASVAEDAQTTATGTLPTPLDMDTHDSVSFLAQNGTPGTYGTLTLNADGSYAYALDNTSPTVQGLGVGETLTDTFTYTVTDNHGATASNTLTVTIHGTNDAPTVAAAAASVTEDTQITTSGTLPTPSDTDVHDTVSFLTQSGAPGTYGTFTLSADGSYTYALNNNLPAVQALGVGETLTDTFAYAVTDGHGGIGINTLTGTINGTNDAPTVAAAASSVTEDSQTTASGILPTPQDTDTHDSVSFLAQNGTPGTYGAFTLNADGSYTYILNNSLPAVQSLGVGETLTDTFTYTVTDNHGAIGSNTLTVTIHGTNDAPTVAAAAASVTEDTQITTSGTLPTPQDTDTHDTVSFVAQSGTPGTYGTFTLNADGSYTYVLNNSLPAIQTLGVGETLTDTITYTVSDGHGGTASNTLTVTINGTNDAPTAAAAGAFVTEDTQATASGTLPLPQDPDLHDTVTFIPKTNETGTYGSLNLNADGSYTYALNNASPLVQGLGAGETVTDTFTYTVSDGHGGTASNTLTVTISGTNDVPAVAAAAASVTEDTQISASGTLPQPQDPDLRDTVSFIPKTNETGTYGSLNLNADGSYTYTLDNTSPYVRELGAGETATDTFTYTVSDGHGGTASNTLTVTISGTNDAPTVAAAAASVTEDTQISASGTLPQPQDPDLHDTVAFTPKAGEAGTYGSLTLNADGSYTYTLNNASPLVQGLGAGETVADTFTYTASDGHGGTASNTLTVTISGTNDAPTVAAATASVAEDTQISASGTLPQPQDADIRDTVAFTPLSNAAGTYGTLTLNADGSYAYTLNNASPAVQGLGAGETATDVFTYTVTDGHGATASNTLTVTIHGTNDAPTVVAAVASVTEDTQILASGTLPVPHDTDTHDTVAFTPKLNETGTYGSLTLNADGTYIYTLNNASPAVQGLGAGETATDVFTYTVTDGHGGTGSNTLTVTIRGTNDIPTVAAATASATEDAQITASGTLPLPQDTDIHDTLTFTTKVAEAGLYGTLTLNADGSYTYTLNNASPLVQGLGAGESVTDAFIYTASDGHGGTVSNTLTVTINGTNDTPSVAAAVASVTEDTKITASGTLPAPQDADIHDTVAFLPQTNTAGLYGSLTLNADGTYTYTLNNASPLVQGLGTGESVTDAFTYTVSDGHGGTASNTLTVTINGTEDLPVLTPATASVREDVQLTASGVVPPPFDADIRDTLTFTAKANEAGRFGTLTLNADGTYTYTLNNSLSAVQALGVGETLTDVFQYTVTDSQGGSSSSTLTVTINGTNDVPTVAASVASVTEDTKITASGILPTPQDTDIHDPLAFTPKVAEAGLYGKLTLAANGSYTYTLNNSLPAVQRLGVGETATDTFTYTVSDGHGGTATNTLTVTINGTNDAPTIGASTASVTEDTLLTATGSVPVPRDPDVHDVLSIQPMSNVAGTYGTLTLNADGTYTYTLNNSLPAVQALGAGERLLDVFTYTVRDNHGATGSNTLTVTINGTNDTPSVGNATATVTEDTQTTATGFLPSPTDPDAHDSVPFLPQNATAGLYGTLTLRADGSYTYALNNALPAVQALGVGETLSDTFTYTVSDGHGGTASNTLTVTISGTNDTPVASAAIASVIEDTQITTAGTLPPPRDIDIRDSVSFVPQPLSAGTYGTLTLAADGTYTYTLNNSLPAVQALGAGETLTDTLSYGVVDNHGAIGTGTLTVTISGTNDAPTATAAAASVTEDLALTATGVLPPPRDVDIHDTLSFLPKAAEPGLYGTLTLRADGSYTYTLNNALPAVQALGVGETLTDTFTCTVSDGHGGTGSSTLTITVNGTDDAPSVAAAAASVTEDTGLTASGTLPAPTDPDAHDTPVFIPKTAEAGLYGSLTLNADGTYTYTLNNGSAAVQALGAGEKLADTFTYTVSDGHGGTASNTLTLTINGTNDAPSVAAAADSVKEDVKLTTSGILPAPTDQDAHDTPVFAPKTAEAGLYGSLTLNADGSYTYTLNNALPAVQTLGVGETLTDTFTYTVSDGHGGTASNTLTLTINGTNDTPSVGPTFGFVTEDTLTVLNGALSTPTDPDTHDMPVFVAKTAETGLYGSLTLRADGTYTYTLNNSMNAVQGLGQGETLRDIFTYTVSDGHGGTASNVLTVIINGTNDAPAVAAAVAAVTEDAKLTAAGKLPTPTDIDAHDTVSFIPKTGEAGRYGTLTLNAAGAYTYTLNNSLSVVQALGQGESLSETFNYTVKDQHGGITVGTLTVNISGTNDLPVPTVQTASLTEDVKAVALGSLRPVPDPDVNDIVTFVPQSSTAGLYGTLTLNANGSYVYVLNNSSAAVQGLGPGESVTDTFAYAVSDGHGGTAASTLTLTINGTNDAPTVGTASASIGEEAAGPTNALSGLLPTPYDADIRDTVSFVPQTNRAGTWGTLTLRADGTYTYALTDSAALHSLGAGQIAYDTFAYTVADNHGASVSNTLTITVIGVNDAPSVASATASVQEDTLLTASGILPAPTDPDAGDRPQFVMQLSTQGQYGTLFLSPAGAYTYTLNNGLPAVHALGEGDTLTDTFTYTVTDGHGGTATNTLTVTINGTNDAPTVDAADAAITEGVAQTAGTLPTPQDPDAHDVPVFVPQTGAAGLYGSLTLDASGAYVYTLNNSLAVVKQLGLGETLTDTFTYTVTDNHGGTATNTLTVTVNGINTPPLTGTITAGSVTEDTSTVLTGIMTAPPDPNPHDTVVFLPQTGTAGAYGTLTLAASGRYTYVLNNTLPAVQGLGVGETLTDTLAATVSDGKGGLTQTTLAITINGTNDLPSVAPSSGAITEDTAILAGTLSLPTDPDIHDTPAFLPQLGTAGAYGTLTLNADGTYSYALNNSLSAVQGLGVGETLTDSFAYTVSDGHGGTASNTLTITISGANDAPAALAATASVIEDTALSASGVLPRPSDPDFHDTVAFIPLAARAGAYGTLTLAADGHYTYVLNNTLPAVQGLGVGETLTDTITYQVIDNHGATGSATLTVTINGTNDNPIVTPLTASILETAASVSGVLPAPTDPDIHDAPAYVPIAARAGIYGSLTLNADGSYTYVLNQSQPAVQGLGQGETLTDTFAYSVVDGHGGAASGTLTVTVNGINNPPTVAASAAVIAEHTPYVTGVLPSPDDPDIHDTVSFTPATLTGRYGTLSLDAHGGYVYTLNAHSPDVSGLGQGESLTDTITYGIADDKGGTGTGTLTVTINGTNDAPVLGPQAASVSVGGTVTAAGTLIAGDPDAHDTVSFTPFTAQAGLYGTLTLNADGTYAYTLNSGLSAVRQLSIGDTLQDVFLCQAQDQYGLTGSGTLTVTINGGNEAPTVAAATASVTEDLALTATGTLPAPQDINIHDAIGFVPLSAQAGTYGTLTLTAGGRYIYVLNNALPSVQALGTGETLTDTFTYQAIDNHGAIGSNTLTVTINGTNDAPTMSLAAAAFARTDLTLTGVLPPPHDPDAHDTASYQPLTAQAGLYGTLTLNADGTYTYVLNSTLDTVRELGAGESLQDVFSCTVIDSHGTTGAGVFTITINGSNDAPTAADATASVTAAVSGDQVLATGILPHPADPNIHDVLSFVPLAAEAGSYGTLTLAADGSWTYTLNNAADAVRQLGAGATLTDTITYQVADNHGATGNATLSVTIYGVNDLPSVAAATASVTEDTAAAASGILPAPTDPDSGDSVSFVPIAGGAGLFGTLNLDADGHYTYTLNNSLAAVQGLGEGQTLTDTFIYTVTDAHGGTGSNTLTVTINGVNDSPSVAAATADVTEDVQTLVTGTLPAPHDPDNYGVPNDILSFTPQIAEPGAYGSLTLNADGTYTYILNNALSAVQNLNAGDTLTDTFTYTVTDNHGGTGSNTLTVTIHGLDEPSGGGTYAAPQTASLSVTAETGEAVPPGTGTTSTLPDYLQPEGDSLASVLNHYASSGSGQGHETAATDGTPPEGGAAPNASPLPSSEDGGAPTVSAPTETAVHDAQPQQYSEPYTPPMESSTETLQQNVSQELARNGGI